MKIAILYICTGKYNQFFQDFYNSSEKFLLKDESEKHYFIWTDDGKIAKGLSNVHIYHKKCSGFPDDSLFRFEMFLQAEEELKSFEYIYFFNANALFLRPVSEDILPNGSGLAMGIWPGKREYQHPMFFPYERNKKSLAYIAPYGEDYTYFMGGINGGTSEAYLEMIRTLAHNIRNDYNSGIVAKVHDESHINAYLRDHPCKKLGREFCLPEEWIQDNEKPKMIFRNKVQVDSDFSKGRSSSVYARLRKGVEILWNIVRWYLKF